MNPFERARDEARRVRDLLAQAGSREVIAAEVLLSTVESVLNLAVQQVPPNYWELGGGTAVLKRDERFIYVSNSVSAYKRVGLVAHELGHWFLDADKGSNTTVYEGHLDGRVGPPAVVKVEAYGAREREELQANVFARELLLPRHLAKALYLSGVGPRKAADELGIPLEFVRHQMLDAILLPEEGHPAPKPLHPPSPDQKAAAEAKERFANVVAGPGTGKTSTLIQRIKYLVEKQGVDPSHILALTFTNKAAAELVERLRSAGIARVTDIWAGTFHAFGLEFFRKYHQRFGLEPDVLVADKLNVITLLSATIPGIKLQSYLRIQDPYEWLAPMLTAIARLKEELVSPEDYRKRIALLPSPSEEVGRRREDLAVLYEAHEHLLAKAKTLDFVDLIAKPAMAIRDDRAPYSALADKFQHILVDEYQDVTQAMVELLRQLAQKADSLWVVGDVRQAIHHWRGASVRSLLKFEATFRSQAGKAKIRKYSLKRNRRSTQEILDLVEHAGKIHVLEGSLPLDAMVAEAGTCGELPQVVTCSTRKDILAAILSGIQKCFTAGDRYVDQTVLCRKGADVESVADYLRAHGIPTLYIGEIAQRTEVKKILCLLQLLTERQPRALVGLKSVPGLEMSKEDIDVLLAAALADVRWQRGRWLSEVPPGLSRAGLKSVARLQALLGGRTSSSKCWDLVCDLLLEQRSLVPDLNDKPIESCVGRIALWQFAHSVRNGDGESRGASISRFLLRQRLRQRIGETYADREIPPEASSLEAVRVLTVHGSKGLEFSTVHLPFVCAESYGDAQPSWVWPNELLEIVPPEVLGSSNEDHDFEAAVERNNLLYVGLSRARRRLVVYQEDASRNNQTLQLSQPPKKYRESRFIPSAAPNGGLPPSGASTPHTPFVSFEQLTTYARCPLQYRYKYLFGLQSEQALEPFARARIAIQSALDKAADAGARSENDLSTAWVSNHLPDPASDLMLWDDALLLFRRGLAILEGSAHKGGVRLEPQTPLPGLTVQLPWGIAVKEGGITTFNMIRVEGSGLRNTTKLLRPFVNGLQKQGIAGIELHTLFPLGSQAVGPSKSIAQTDAAKAAAGLLRGDYAPVKGRHCSRCPYLTICPSTPASNPPGAA